MKYNFIVVGASQAGLTGVKTLRERMPDATILLINGEDRLPYKRTKLTKKLASGFSLNDFALNDESWYDANSIELWNHCSVLEIDQENHTLICSDGRKPGWDKLLLATGGVPVQLDIPGKEHIMHLRTAADTENIRTELLKSRRVLVIGQGVEAVEIAEQCKIMGQEVSLIGRDSRLMERWLDERLSSRILKLLSSHGINCSFNKVVSHVTKLKDTYQIHTAGEIFEADIVLSSIGMVGNPDLSEALGIYAEKGVGCVDYLQTEITGIYAAGDVVESPPGWPRGLWHWAEYQGRISAINMSGGSRKIENIPTRLKCEPFGKFYFSMALQDVMPEDQSAVIMDNELGYLKIFTRKAQCIAALMEGLGKEKSKILEKGVRQGLSLDQLLITLK